MHGTHYYFALKIRNYRLSALTPETQLPMKANMQKCLPVFYPNTFESKETIFIPKTSSCFKTMAFFYKYVIRPLPIFPTRGH